MKGILFFVIFLASTGAIADQTVEPKRGYWWGKGKLNPEPVEPEEAEEIEPEKIYKALPPLPPEEELMSMHPEDLRTLETQYLDNALYLHDDPTKTEEYYRLVSVIRKKSKAFAANTVYNALQNPDINLIKDRPVSNQGRRLRAQQDQQLLNDKIDSSRDQYALVLFTQRTCGLCEGARSTLRIFNRNHQWPIKEVDIDQNPQLASRHDVRTTPTTLLIRKHNKQAAVVALGDITVPELERNIYSMARILEGDAMPAQFGMFEDQKGSGWDPIGAKK